jgi:hypothetical protein
MIGRERILSRLNSIPIDNIKNRVNNSPEGGLCWTILVDDVTRSIMPDHYRKMPMIDFYKAIGCDIFQFGNYGLPENQQVVSPCCWAAPGVTSVEYRQGETLFRKIITSWGELLATFSKDHPLKYPVATAADLRILKRVWAKAYYEEVENGDGGYDRLEALIGDEGVYIPTVDPSPVQHLLEYEMGLENFYALLHDEPGEMEDLLEIMHHCRLQEYEILARRTRAAAIISVENTSTTLISPTLCRKFSLGHLQEFVQVVHAHGKKAILHMCGHLKHLLPLIKDTGLDGVHAITPPTVGDTPFELAWDVLGDRVTLLGLLDGAVFHDPHVSKPDIFSLLDRTFTPRVRAGNFILVVAADGLPTPLEKFSAVQEWMQQNN